VHLATLESFRGLRLAKDGNKEASPGTETSGFEVYEGMGSCVAVEFRRAWWSHTVEELTGRGGKRWAR
jgi:hypothetical protein